MFLVTKYDFQGICYDSFDSGQNGWDIAKSLSNTLSFFYYKKRMIELSKNLKKVYN